MARAKKAEYLEMWPFIPGQPQWADVPWDKARAMDPRVDGFIGHNSTHFVFQVRGVCRVEVAK